MLHMYDSPPSIQPDCTEALTGVLPSTAHDVTGTILGVLIFSFQAHDGLQQSQYLVVVPEPDLPLGIGSISGLSPNTETAPEKTVVLTLITYIQDVSKTVFNFI